MDNNSLFERLSCKIESLLTQCRLPFFSALVCGLLAHGYAFTNKLLNADETAALFSKGADVTSGRFGLVLSSYLFPDMSMPWIYGLISILLLSVAAFVTVRIFKIESPLLQAVTAASITVFPAQTGTFCFMYTSSAYALAVLLSVLAVYFGEKGGKARFALAFLSLGLSLLIYQAYISLTASFFVILLIQKLLDKDSSAADALKGAVKYVVILLAALGLYLLVTTLVKRIGGTGYQEYETFAEDGILSRVRVAYTSFVRVFVSGYFGFVNSKLSLAAHILCGAAGIVAVFAAIRSERDGKKTALLFALLFVFPLAVNCLYLIASVNIIHSVSQFGFVSVYVLAAVAADRLRGKLLRNKDIVIVSLSLVVLGNIFFANEVYLKMHLAYENAYAFYNTLMTQIMETPGFSEYTVIDLVGNESRGVYSFDKIDTKGLVGPNRNLVDIYTRENFIYHYMGLKLYLYREDVIWADWFYEMPTYPDPGSIVLRPEEGRIVVKLS